MAYTEAIITFIVSALSIVIALAWRDYINDMFDRYIKKRLTGLSPAVSGIIYVAIVTFIGITISLVLTEQQERHEKEQEERERRLIKRVEENRNRVQRVGNIVDEQIQEESPDPDEVKENLPKPSYRVHAIRSILGVDDKKVVSSALEESREIQLINSRLSEYDRKLSSAIIPKDVGLLHGRYE